MSKQKSEQLKILLLKTNVGEWGDALKDAGSVIRYELRSALPYEGALFIQKPISKPPRWRSFIQAGVATDIIDLTTATSAAVLFVEAGGRKFALTFGYGRNLLLGDCFERGFGLKVVLNTVNPESVRSIDAKTIEELTLVTRRQASRASTFGTFGLDTDKDLLRGVTGKPRNEEFAIRVAGSDSLTISVPIEFHELGKKCKQLLSAYFSDAYKEAFDFIDHLRIVQDKSLKSQFDESLITDLKNGSTEKMHLAPPEPIDWENVSGFTYHGARRANVYLEMDIDEMDW